MRDAGPMLGPLGPYADSQGVEAPSSPCQGSALKLGRSQGPASPWFESHAEAAAAPKASAPQPASASALPNASALTCQPNQPGQQQAAWPQQPTLHRGLRPCPTLLGGPACRYAARKSSTTPTFQTRPTPTSAQGRTAAAPSTQPLCYHPHSCLRVGQPTQQRQLPLARRSPWLTRRPAPRRPLPALASCSRWVLHTASPKRCWRQRLPRWQPPWPTRHSRAACTRGWALLPQRRSSRIQTSPLTRTHISTNSRRSRRWCGGSGESIPSLATLPAGLHGRQQHPPHVLAV